MHSEKARAYLEAFPDQQFFFCRMTQLAVLRLLTTEKVMGSDTLNMVAAWDMWDNTCVDSRVAFLQEPEDLDRRLRTYSSLTSASPKIWADAYLLAFASVAHLRLVTFDRALAARGEFVALL